MLFARRIALALSFQILVSVEGLRKRVSQNKNNVSSYASPTAADVLRSMGKGINLGNVYDAPRGGVWNDPSFATQAARIDSLHAAGFTNVRVPVTWGDTFQWDARTSDANATVRYAIQKGLYVVLDTHHEHWLKDDYDGSSYYDSKFSELWRNIATLFQDVGPQLVFETLNEPEGAMGFWSGLSPFDPVAIARTRQINQVAYDAIRRVSPNRVILVTPNGQGNQACAPSVYPNRQSFPDGGGDPYLAITVHTYDPWDFCGQTGSNAHFGSRGNLLNALGSQFNALFDWAARTNIPVHLGEYGVGRLPGRSYERNTDLVREYYSYVTNLFVQRGMPTSVWDDQGWFAVMLGTNQFVNGLADSMLGSSGGPPSPPPSPPSGGVPSPPPSPPSGGSGCCQHNGVCNCGNDGTGWCNDSPSNCGVCNGSWDPAGAAPTCPPGGGGGCCKNGFGLCDCGSDGTGWCHGSPDNCNVCTGIWDNNAAAPSCR